MADSGRVVEYSPCGGGKDRVVRLVVAVNILLGPEGTTVWLVLLDGDLLLVWGQCPGGCGPARVVVGCVFVENCTVDASIFVVKLLRAHGGCLGTRSR